MAKKRAKRRSWFGRRKRRTSKNRQFPLAMLPSIVVPVAAILGGSNTNQPHGGLVQAAQTGDVRLIMEEVKNVVPYEIIGYRWDGVWDFGIIARNLGLALGGFAVHKVAGMTGVNKYFKRIPMIGKYIAI